MASVPLFPRAHLSKCSSFSGALTQTSKTLAHFLKTAGMQYFSFPVFSPHEKLELFPEKLKSGSYISIWIIVPGLVPCQQGPQACSSSYDDDSQSKGFVQPNPTVILQALQLRCQICTSSESVKFSEILKVKKMHFCTASVFNIRRE